MSELHTTLLGREVWLTGDRVRHFSDSDGYHKYTVTEPTFIDGQGHVRALWANGSQLNIIVELLDGTLYRADMSEIRTKP